MVAAENQLSRHYALPALVERELEDHAGLHPRLIGLGAGAVAEAQVLVCGKAAGASGRQDDGELGLNLEVTGMELNAGFELGYAFIESPHADAKTCGFEEGRKSGGAKK
jgi:hypothetical protein